jgi:uncharacterized caspase-like protein
MDSLGYLQVGIAALFLAFAGAAVAAEKRVALAIGNATYAHANVLKTPSNDARLVAMTLRTIGFTEVLEHHDLDRAAFEGVLDRFAAQARTADWALIYYAGHAVEIGGAFYLLPTDANVKSGTDLDKEGISLGRVLGPGSLPRQLTIAVLDTARTNSIRPAATPPSLSKWPQREGELFVAFATGPGRGLAASPGDNGAFASSLAHRIAMPGLDIQAIFDQVRQDVLQATGGRQIPWAHAALKGRYEFVTMPR